MKLITRIILASLITLSAAGCSTSQHTMTNPTTNSSVELLYFDGCPNTPPFRESLEAAIAQIGGSFDPIDLTTLAQDDIRRGYGSPTILLNGRDLFDMPQPQSPTMSCRVYPQGLPDTDTLISKLSENTP